MWNPDAWRESEEEAVAENHVPVGTFRDQTTASTTKRQRRPNVRLGELANQLTSPLPDKRKKRKGKSPSIGVCIRSKRLHKQSRFDVGDDVQRTENALPFCLDAPAEPCPASEKTIKLQKILNLTSKKGQNRCRKPAVSEVGDDVKKLPFSLSGTSIRACCRQKTPCMQRAKDMHFDKENNTHSPALFEASGYQDVISPFGRSKQDDMVLLRPHQNFHSGDCLPSRAQGRGERAHPWTQWSSRMQAFKLINDADGKLMPRANLSVRVPKGKLVVKATGSIHGTTNKCMPHANSSGHVPKGKLVVKANGLMLGTRNKLVVEDNGNGELREPSKNNADRPCLWPWPGVTGWLQDLGLAKYAHIFEAHEVELEVLPLLTLDDLREMGVAAVGSRRKMFSAIQHIRKVLLAEAE